MKLFLILVTLLLLYDTTSTIKDHDCPLECSELSENDMSMSETVRGLLDPTNGKMNLYCQPAPLSSTSPTTWPVFSTAPEGTTATTFLSTTTELPTTNVNDETPNTQEVSTHLTTLKDEPTTFQSITESTTTAMSTASETLSSTATSTMIPDQDSITSTASTVVTDAPKTETPTPTITELYTTTMPTTLILEAATTVNTAHTTSEVPTAEPTTKGHTTESTWRSDTDDLTSTASTTSPGKTTPTTTISKLFKSTSVNPVSSSLTKTLPHTTSAKLSPLLLTQEMPTKRETTQMVLTTDLKTTTNPLKISTTKETEMSTTLTTTVAPATTTSLTIYSNTTIATPTQMQRISEATTKVLSSTMKIKTTQTTPETSTKSKRSTPKTTAIVHELATTYVIESHTTKLPSTTTMTKTTNQLSTVPSEKIQSTTVTTVTPSLKPVTAPKTTNAQTSVPVEKTTAAELLKLTTTQPPMPVTEELSTISTILSPTPKVTQITTKSIESTTSNVERTSVAIFKTSPKENLPTEVTNPATETTTTQEGSSSYQGNTALTKLTTIVGNPTTEESVKVTTNLGQLTTLIVLPTSSELIEATEAATEVPERTTTSLDEATTGELIATTDEDIFPHETDPEESFYPCPYQYIEGENWCYTMVPPSERNYFITAFGWCRRHPRRDMIRIEDLSTERGIQSVQYLMYLYNLRYDSMYLNGNFDRKWRKENLAGLVNVSDIKEWRYDPYNYTGIRTKMENVTGICRMPKFGRQPTCNLTELYTQFPGKLEEIGNRTLIIGSYARLKCIYPSRDILTVKCLHPGSISPHPTRLSCSIPEDVKYEEPEVEFWGNRRVRESCAECYSDGTANCTREGGGYLCNCKKGWTKFTCRKEIDLCEPLVCGRNGTCVTQLGKFFCRCNDGFAGDRCEINIKRITWEGNTTVKMISINTFSSGLVAVSSFAQVALKIWSKIITDQETEDPQETYQTSRFMCMGMANLVIAIFQHPDLLAHESQGIPCRWLFSFVHFTYCLGFCFLLNEVLNVCTTIHGLHRNNWIFDNKKEERWFLKFPARVSLPAVVVYCLMWFVRASGWQKIPKSWTCFGSFRRDTAEPSNPILDSKYAPGGSDESVWQRSKKKCQFWLRGPSVHVPQLAILLLGCRHPNGYRQVLVPVVRYLLLDRLNIPDTDNLDGNLRICLLLWPIVPSRMDGFLYPTVRAEKVGVAAGPYLQELTPMNWLSRAEIFARHNKTEFNGFDASSPFHPASICYITLEHEHMMLRRMTREYLDHRVTHQSTQKQATLSIYFNELRLRHVYEKNAPLEDLHLELILQTWITEVKRIDQIELPPKPKKVKVKETWRTRLHAKHLAPAPENSNLRRMRFMKTCMDYHLKTLNPTLEYPVEGAMQRTDFRTFSPACPCVLRSQVEFLQRTWLPIIDIYIENDWSFREVYKDVQQAEGYPAREPRYECKKEDVEEDHWLNELRPGFIGPRSYPLFYLPALGTYLELDYYQRFADLEWARLVKTSEYLGACYDFGR